MKPDREKIMPALRSKHYLGIVALFATSFAAATEAEDAIAACARISSTGDRILCLETALRNTSTPAVSEATSPVGTEDTLSAPVTMESMDVEIIEVRKSGYGKLLFITADGQIWQQTDMKSVGYREFPFDAIIREAAAGGFFIRPLAGGVSVRVRRQN